MDSTPTDRAAAAYVSDHKRGNLRDRAGFAVRLRPQARKRYAEELETTAYPGESPVRRPAPAGSPVPGPRPEAW
jgi:hypothetical protein